MIPRFQPYFDQAELNALFQNIPDAVRRFEQSFARQFDAQDAVAFPYGRSALWAFFKTLDIKGAEIIQPAYTCVVVAHATILSGNLPRFVDINLTDYNMNLDQVKAAITPRTRAIIATHLFGYPLNVNALQEIVSQAEAKYRHKIWVVQDCAHSFGARWQGQLVCAAGDVALFGLGISKTITSIFGGMLTFQDTANAEKVRAWRSASFYAADWLKKLRRIFYLLAVYPAFSEPLYDITYWLQEATPFLNRLTKAYHLDEKIHFPPDYLQMMATIEAQIGLTQLQKYDAIIAQRQENARYYHENLPENPGWHKPPLVEGATYSHYVVRVPDRDTVLRTARRWGVELGQIIEYSIPHLQAYQSYTDHNVFPISLYCSQHMINLPLQSNLKRRHQDLIIATMENQSDVE